MSETGPKWVDLFGIDPDYCEDVVDATMRGEVAGVRAALNLERLSSAAHKRQADEYAVRLEAAEAAVARVRAVLADPRTRWWHTGGTACSPRWALVEALEGPEAPAGAGEAPGAAQSGGMLGTMRDPYGKDFR